MIRRGQIHINTNGKTALGPMGEGGTDIPINRNQLHLDTIKPYLKESQMTKNLDESAVRSIKIVRVEASDTEEEGDRVAVALDR